MPWVHHQAPDPGRVGSSGARRNGRREAERLLAREPATADRAGLADVLAHAAAPPLPDELHGGDTALAEYVRAVCRARASPTTPSRPRASTVDARSLLAVQLACAAAALGGVMWAAQAGALPAPAQQIVHDLLGPVGVPAPAPRDNATAPAAVRPTTHTTAAPTAQPGTEPGRDEPPMVALCRAYLGHQNDPANAPPLDPAAVDRLARAANGPAKVEDYCGTLLAEHASDRDWPNATQPPEFLPRPPAHPAYRRRPRPGSRSGPGGGHRAVASPAARGPACSASGQLTDRPPAIHGDVSRLGCNA